MLPATTLLQNINLVLVTGLGITAGIPKILRVQPEVAFFQGAGLGETSVMVFGLVQVAGGILLATSRTRTWGAIVTATAFLMSAAMLLLAGQTAFGFFSILPVLMAVVVATQKTRNVP